MTQNTNTEIIQQWAAMPRSAIEAFGDEGDFARQALLTPTILSLLGDVAGKRILDAGCGNGYLCRLLSELGAKVTGLEPAAPLLDYALEREGKEPQEIRYIQADLTSWRSEDRFDNVIANMVLMDIPDYQAALDTCLAHLKPNGRLLISLTHPCFEASDSEFREKGFIAVREYFQTYRIPQQWGDRFHRPLSDYFNALIQRGGLIKAVVEPKLTTSQAQYPVEKERNLYIPSFILILASKSA